jgi:sigma-B regulation protein RsbU (phosphoserine phosphatase)
MSSNPRRANILLVDDNPANLRLLSQILGERGHHVRAVTSGQRALESVRIDPPDIVLLDIRMPGMDGYEVCALLKADPASARVPVLFISALDEIQDKVKAFSAGGLDYVTKPFQLEEVVARVETHLALRALQRDLEEANRRMEQELVLAAQVQASFMPGKLPDLPGWELAVSLLPAKLISGDFYDAIPLPGGELAVLIADVVDKGVGAALYMAMSIALLRAALAEFPTEPARVCEAVSRQLHGYATGNQFVTVFLGILNPRSGRLAYSNAGHNPPILLGASQPDGLLQLKKTGLALGVLEDSTWESGCVQMEQGDALVLYSDGITEAENGRQEFYRLHRLLAAARENAGRSAAALRDAILDGVQQFMGGAEQSDDIALLVLVRE